MKNIIAYNRRKRRVRYKLKKHLAGKNRLTIFRSSRHIYVQVINDAEGKTVASVSTQEQGFIGSYGSEIYNRNNKKSAAIVGAMIAERLKTKGVALEIAFDRGPFKYCGVIKEFADAARNAGMKF